MIARAALSLGAALTLSCVRDSIDSVTTSYAFANNISVYLNASTTLADDVYVRAIILGAEGSRNAGDFCNNEILMSQSLIMQTLSGVRDIYYMAYAPAVSGLEGNISASGYITTSELSDATIGYDPAIYSISNELHFPAIAKSLNTTLHPGGVNVLEGVEMVRRAAKVEVNLSYTKLPEKYSEIDYEILSIQIIDLPRWCYWIDEVYYPVAEGFIDSDLQSTVNTVSGPQLDTDTIADHLSTNIFYVPSYYVTGDNSAKLAITVRRYRKDGMVLDDGVQEYVTKYFAVGDALSPSQTGSDRMDLSPNSNYNINLVINAESFVLYADIVPWDRVDVSGDIVEPNTIDAPSLIVMDTFMLFGSTSCEALFSATLPIEAYVNGRLVVEGSKLTDYVDSSLDYSWLLDSTLHYDVGVDNSGWVFLDYDPMNLDIEEENCKIEVVFKSGYLTRTMTVLSGLYGGGVNVTVGEWELTDYDDYIEAQRSLYLPAYTVVNPSVMGLTQTTITVPFRSTSDATLNLVGGHKLVEGEGVDLSVEDGFGWVTRVDFFSQTADSDGTKYLTFTINKSVNLDDVDTIRFSFSLSILDGAMKVDSYLLFEGQSHGVDMDTEEDWDSSDVDGEIFEQYLLNVPTVNAVSVNTLKAEGVDYYDIIYTSTLTATAVVGGVAIDRDKIIFSEPLNGWLTAMQFVDGDYDGDLTVLRVWVDVDYGDDFGYTGDMEDLSVAVDMLSHNITKHITIVLHDLTEDMDGFIDDEWELDEDINGDVGSDVELSFAPFNDLSRWVYMWYYIVGGEAIEDDAEGGYTAPELVEMTNAVDGYFFASIPYSSNYDLTIELPGVVGTWVESVSLTAEPWDYNDPYKDLGTPADAKGGWVTVKFSRATDLGLEDVLLEVIFDNGLVRNTMVLYYGGNEYEEDIDFNVLIQ